MKNPYGWWLPLDISTHGWEIDRLIVIFHILMGALFLGWLAFLIYTLVRFRSRGGHQAEYKPEHHFKLPAYLEVGIAVIEIVLLTAFSFPIWQRAQIDRPDPDKALTVRVVAEQFAWNVHYPGADRRFGRVDPKLMNASNPLGLDPQDANGKDDVATINQLHVPVNTPVIVDLSSKDVIHSFFLPVARVKHDAIPGQKTSVWFEAKETGEFEIACAQLCGLGHYRMRGFFTVDSKDKFDQWMAEQTGQPAGGGSA